MLGVCLVKGEKTFEFSDPADVSVYINNESQTTNRELL